MRLTRDRAELVAEAARKLQIIATGNTLEAEYAEQIDEKLDPLLMQLSVDNICNIGDTDQIPSEIFDSLARLLANISADDFGAQFDPGIKQIQEAYIKRTMSSRGNRSVQEAEYF